LYNFWQAARAYQSLKQSLLWYISGEEFHGNIDYIVGNVSSEEAMHALVFKAVAITVP
jgi:hypothetical protein